jgi:sulfoxide reductase heme-binding subunit YedZ
MFLSLIIGYLGDWLGNSPVHNLQIWTGRIALGFLLASLTITPLRTISGWSIILPLRKTFGLNAFYWAASHLLVYVALIHRFDLPAIFAEITIRRFIFPGAFAFLILIILAITTINPVKKAVRKIWRKIHMWVYLANVLALLHFSGATSLEVRDKPLVMITAVYMALLFFLRLKPVKMAIIRRRQGMRKIDTSSN